MKKFLPVYIFLLSIIIASCGTPQTTEALLPSANIDIDGNAFQAFKLNGDVKLLATPVTGKSSKWTLKATAPIQKSEAAAAITNPITLQLNLLDENGINVGEGIYLEAEDMDNILPVLNSSPEAEKTVVFSVVGDLGKEYSHKEVEELISKVKKIRLTVISEQPVAVETAETKSEALTLNDLLEKYEIHKLLGQYDYWLKKDDEDRAEDIEDKLNDICKKVKNDNSIPESLRNRFDDYVDDKVDEIEDKY